MNKKSLIIIPTYNENENIKKIISIIKEIRDKTEVSIEVLVVDDSSPDGTAQTVKEIQSMEPVNDKMLHLIEREGKQGLATAYCKGFKWAIKNKYDYVIQMDADLSHNPKDIIQFLNKINKYDVIVGSRYKTGINVVNWPLRRLFLSYFANVYARIFTGMKIKDLTSGFKCIKVDALKNIDIDSIKSEGYSFQIEVNFLFHNKEYIIYEMPIIFHDRTVGQSKMSKKIILEAIFRVPMFRIKKIFNIK